MVGYGKGPATVGYPGSSAQGGQSAPQATGKGPSSGGGGGWASGGRISRATGGAALLEQLAARHLAQYGQMAGGPGTEAHSRIKHSLQQPSAEAVRRFSPGSLPSRPQSGVKTAADMGTQLANLYKTGKQLKTDVTDFLKEKQPAPAAGQQGASGGTTTTTTTPGGSAPAAASRQQGASLEQPNMDESVRGAAGRVFGMGNEGSGLAPAGDMVADLRPEESLEALGGLGGGGDLLSAFAARGGRINRDAGGRIGYRAGGLPSGLVQGEGIEIPDDPSSFKLGEGLTKPSGMGGGGGGGGNPLGTALTVASLATKAAPYIMAMLPSDARIKHHKEPIGELFDGQKVYRYDFGDGRTEIGLMAQEVEKHHPEAVRTVDGIKMVDYDKAVSRVKKQIGGGLGDIPVLEEDRRATDEADLNDRRVRLAALQRSETMSDAEPTGLVAGARVASASPAAPIPATAPPPASAEPTVEPRPPVPPASIVDRATEVTRNIPMGPVEKVGEKLGVPELMRDERVFVPLIAGLGAMLASDKPRFSQALGEGLAGAAGAYGAVRGQTQDIERSAAEVRAIDTATYQKSLMVTPNGNFVWLANGGFMDAGEWDQKSREGNAPALLGRIPGDAEETIRKAIAAKTAGAGMQPPAVKSPSEPGASSAAPGEGGPGVKPQAGEPGARTDEGSVAKPKPATSALPGLSFSDETAKEAEKERRLGISGGVAAETARATTQRYNAVTDTGANGAREAQRYLSELALNLSKAAKGKGLDVPGFGFNGRAELTNAFNTISRAFKGPEIGSADTVRDVNKKIETLLAAAKAAGGNQESFAALERLGGAIANPNMSPRAFSLLAADLMVQNQMALDRAIHKDKYLATSNGFLSRAGSRFNADNPETKYTKEINVLQQLILRDPKLLDEFRSGAYTPSQIDQAFKQKFGVDGMGRYFGRGT
jgi:hypothetical protein